MIRRKHAEQIVEALRDRGVYACVQGRGTSIRVIAALGNKSVEVDFAWIIHTIGDIGPGVYFQGADRQDRTIAKVLDILEVHV